MAIRTKEYRYKAGGNRRIRAIRITEKNISELVAFINRNGGKASERELKNGGQPRIDIYQVNHGPTHSRRGWRVAQLGDFIVKYENGTFARIKDDVFEAEFALA